MRHVQFQPLSKLSPKARGTSLQCYATFSYDDIVSTFGEPHTPADNKTSAEWQVEVIQDDEPLGVVTIYDYKEHIGYRQDGLPTQDITEWHVGAKNNRLAVDVVDFIITSIKHNEKYLQKTST